VTTLGILLDPFPFCRQAADLGRRSFFLVDMQPFSRRDGWLIISRQGSHGFRPGPPEYRLRARVRRDSTRIEASTTAERRRWFCREAPPGAVLIVGAQQTRRLKKKKPLARILLCLVVQSSQPRSSLFCRPQYFPLFFPALLSHVRRQASSNAAAFRCFEALPRSPIIPLFPLLKRDRRARLCN